MITLDARRSLSHVPVIPELFTTGEENAHVAQLVEHVLGKDEVTRSIRVVGSMLGVGLLPPKLLNGCNPPLLMVSVNGIACSV